MKKLYVFLIAVVLAGCQLDAIQRTGEYCPPLGSNESLLYIENAKTCNAENISECTINDEPRNYAYYFENGICPEEYSKCISETTDEGVAYHCEKDIKVVCGSDDVLDCRDHSNPESEADTTQCILKLNDAMCGVNNCEEENYGGTNCTAIGKHCQKTDDGQYECVCDEGELSCSDGCIDPSKDETCGADQCDAENYGGMDCAVNNGRCKLKEDKYVCVCNNDALSCGNKCIDPRDEETCGANDCDAENYGGMDCTQIEDMRCVAGDDEIYSCQCAPGFILCDGKCIKPSYDDNYCGAVGACSSTDPESPDFMGYDCKANGGLCRDGQCTCFAGSWCTVEGEEQPRCVDPSANETCNATLNETTGVCTIKPCQDNESCTARSSTEYYCNIANCLNEDELLCPEPQNGNVCYSKYDIDHCGSCDAKCKILNTSSYQAVGCEDNNGIPGCTFECIEGLTNCGTAFEPVCVEIDINVEHCGTCGQACKPGQYCENGQCMNTDCSETECTTKNSDGDQICVNTNTQCGPNCTPCQNIHANSYCQDGTCFISQCNAGEHPIFNDTGHITACHKNSKTACAPTNRTTSDPIVDCEASKDANVSTVECSDDGYCAIVSCVNGYHMSSGKTSCVKNSNSACGSPTSSTTIKCEIPNAASQACQDDGTCKVTNCNSGYHLSSDGRSCVANTNKLCGATNSSATKNCEEISNKSTVSCENGTCKVTACASGYHPNSGYTACLTNSSTECGTTTSSTVKNCDTSIGNSATTTCSAGTCKVTKCNSGYHLNSGGTGCVQNSKTACAAPNSSTTTDCTAISNVNGTSCSSAGKCVVESCDSGYHITDSNKAGCTKNTNTSCASTTSYSPANCTKIDNVNGTSCSSAGKCVVESCDSGYHITNSSKAGCTKNTDSLCASTTSYSTKNCSSGVTKYCVSGTCKCSTNGSLVLNYNNTACVNKACDGVYGVTGAKTGTSSCIATTCASGYKYDYDPNDSSWGVCRYITSNVSDCKTKLPGVTSARLMGSGTLCQATACSSGYKLSHGVCYPN